MKPNTLSRLLLVSLALIVSACTTLPPVPATASQAAYEYKLGPGDEIAITVWRNPELSATVPVRPDGKITAPLIEDMQAIGKAPSELARDVEKKLGEFVRNPSVSVMVTKFVGNTREQVRVIGQAARPTALPYTQSMTLLDVMIAVGGITEFAAGNRAVLIRGADNNKQYSLRLKDLLQGGDVSANAEVLPGDVIMIPESWL
jgi:polysaccharide export outer membrane protein